MEIKKDEECPLHGQSCPHSRVDECEMHFFSALQGLEKMLDESEADYDSLPQS